MLNEIKIDPRFKTVRQIFLLFTEEKMLDRPK